MDELTRQMDISGGVSGERGEIFEFVCEVLKQIKGSVYPNHKEKTLFFAKF